VQNPASELAGFCASRVVPPVGDPAPIGPARRAWASDGRSRRPLTAAPERDSTALAW